QRGGNPPCLRGRLPHAQQSHLDFCQPADAIPRQARAAAPARRDRPDQRHGRHARLGGLMAGPPLARRLVAEGLGTGLLVATVVGSGIMADRLAGGNQAVALLGNTIPTGAILVVLITILGPISGAHFNPAVSLVFAGRREMPWGEVAPYILAQCVGGVAGTVMAHLMFDLTPLTIGTTPRSGPSQLRAASHSTSPPPLAVLG